MKGCYGNGNRSVGFWGMHEGSGVTFGGERM